MTWGKFMTDDLIKSQGYANANVRGDNRHPNDRRGHILPRQLHRLWLQHQCLQQSGVQRPVCHFGRNGAYEPHFHEGHRCLQSAANQQRPHCCV